jgi:glycogen synthase
MNILFICDEYPPGKNGGIGTVVQTLGRELTRQGHKVFVAGLYAFSYGQADYETDGDIRIWRKRYGLKIPLPPDHPILNKVPGFIKQFLNYRQAFNRFIKFVNKLIKDEGIDIIEIPDWNTFSTCAGFMVKWPAFAVPLVLKSHGSYTKLKFDSDEKPKKLIRKIDQHLYDRADALSAVSKNGAEINKNLFNTSKQIKVLYNSINIPESIPHQIRLEKTVLYSGSLFIKKGVYQLMKAWNEIVKKHPDAELVLYGRGEKEPLKKLLSEKALNTTQFKGHISREHLFIELSRATMAIFPSYTESFALAPLEAMALGCPIINTSRSSGTELVTDGYDGSLIDPDNIQQIVDKIDELLIHKELREKYSINGRQTVFLRFNIVTSAKDHIEFYNEIIKDFKKRTK